MAPIQHTFIQRPTTELATVIKGALARHRSEDTAIVVATQIAEAAPTMFAQPSAASAPPMSRGTGSPTIIGAAPAPPGGLRRADLATTIQGPPAGNGAADKSGERPMIRKSLPIGFVMHRYRIEAVIGEGGFGITYRARDVVIDREVAIKELFVRGACVRTHTNEVIIGHPERNERMMQWASYYFSEEARITFAMRHESIVRIYDFFKTNNTAYIVYEMLDGSDLQGWCEGQQSRLDHGQAVELARATCAALRHVHARGYLHRDIKPANIFMTGDGLRPVLIDFGAASQLGSPTGGGEVIVSPGYAPIEQYDPAIAADERTDIYALSATLYWTLTGRTPPAAPDRAARDELVPPGKLVDPSFRYGERLYRVIEQGLSVRREDRYPNVDAFLDDLFPKLTLQSSGYVSEPRGPKVFVSYRREDSAHFSGRLLDFLELRYGSDAVFFDVQSIPAGTDFWDHIKEVLGQCAVVLIVIGPRWLELLRDRRKRWYQLSGKDDYVAMEIAAALEMRIPIVPVMFDNAAMPRDGDLPKLMRPITKLNAVMVGQGHAFRFGADGIADQIARIRGLRAGLTV